MIRFLFIFCIFCSCWSPGFGTELRRGTAIRDAEIEATLKNYLDPLFTISGLNPNDCHVILVVDPTLNAMALPNNTMLFYTGFLMETKKPEEVAGVLAHEVGHIAARHLVRIYDAMENAQKAGILGMLAGVSVGLLGSPDAGIAVALGSSSQAIHNLMHYQRSEEEVADMLAVKYLTTLHWPISGLRSFFEKLLGQELLSEAMQDPYLRTHPLTRDRVERIRGSENDSTEKNEQMSSRFQEEHKRMVVKLKAFLWPSTRTLETFNGKSVLDLYAQSIAYYRQKDFEKALMLVDRLIMAEPKNPFFFEFKGQILFDAGKGRESIKPYRRAVELLPKSSPLRVGLAQSLLQEESPSLTEEAIHHLKLSLTEEKDNALAWYYLAIAYGKQKKMAPMALALAERALLTQEWVYAQEQAKRVKNFSKKGENFYFRAEEIERQAEAGLKDDKKS